MFMKNNAKYLHLQPEIADIKFLVHRCFIFNLSKKGFEKEKKVISGKAECNDCSSNINEMSTCRKDIKENKFISVSYSYKHLQRT